MSQTFESTTIQGNAVITGRWMTLIYNDSVTPYEAVVQILMLATGCSQDEAEIETWEAHTYGKAGVHFAQKSECERVAEIIRSIGVKTEVTTEWND